MRRPALQINTIEIPVFNLTRAIDWYQSALGFKCAWSDEKHALLNNEADEVEANSSEVRLLLVETLETVRLGFLSSSSGVRHSVIDFKAPDLEALHAIISALGTAVDELRRPSLSWATRGFGFLDSEGNRLAAFSYEADRRG
jgi:predicted enzyme related to lactoylglutathione lyase